MSTRIYKNQVIIIGLIFLSSLISCKKQDDWLNAKRLQGDVTPATISDFQALLDNGTKTNNIYSCAGLLGTDNLYISDVNYQSLAQVQQYLYIFNKEIWAGGGTSQDWTNQYSIMELANIVLDGLKDMDYSLPEYNNVKGQGLFFRASTLFTLSQLFCKPYNASTLDKDLGIPVRLTSDVNVLYQRGTLAHVYEQMIKDDSEAINLLDVTQLYNRRPSKLAGYGLMARINLIMGDYEKAGMYADKAISGGAVLIDYNNTSLVSPTATYPFPTQGLKNSEILFFANCQYYQATQASTSAKGYIEPSLYMQYDDNDLRKKILFRFSGADTIPHFVGSYSGSIGTFCGIATNELYLIRAECYARQGNTSKAMNDLNTLLKNRYATGTFTNLTAPDADSALSLVLKERRKELPFTENIRWEDLRRLNTDIKYQVTVKHIVNGITYSLAPNDPKYVLPIPDDEIQLSNIEQNER